MTTSGSCQMRRPHNFNEIKNWSSDAAVLQVKETRRKDTPSLMPVFLTSLRLKPGMIRLLDVGHPCSLTVRNRDHEMTELYNFIEIIFSGLDLKTNCIYYRIDFGSDNDNISKRIVRKSEKKLKKTERNPQKECKNNTINQEK